MLYYSISTLDNTNLLEGDLERKAKEISEAFDIILMGDMFFDQILGNQLSKLALLFKNSDPRTKRVLVGDPGRWWISQNNTGTV